MWLRPLLQIHDELVFEVPEDRVRETAAFVKACMEARPFEEFDVPILAEDTAGERFGAVSYTHLDVYKRQACGVGAVHAASLLRAARRDYGIRMRDRFGQIAGLS